MQAEVSGGPRVLLVEAFYGGSHKQLLDLLHQNISSCSAFTLPAKKWHWRARTAALYFSQTIPTCPSHRVLFSSSVLNLCELVALRPDLARLKKVLYFHENQLVYPVRKDQERDFQYGYNQVLSCLVADVVVFNSVFNMDSFLSSISSFMKRIPDHRPRDLDLLIRPKCLVLYYPVQFPDVSRFLLRPPEEPPTTQRCDEDPSDQRPGREDPSDQRPGREDPSDQRPGREDPSDQRPGREDPSDQRPGREDPSDQRPGREDPSDQRPGREDPSDQRPGREDPSDQRPGREDPSDQRPGREDPSDQRPGREDPSDQRPGREDPSDQRPGREGDPEDLVKPLHIIWPHRWEHDKNPELFFSTLIKLKEKQVNFHLSVLGETFTDVPEVFSSSRCLLEDEVLNWGFLSSREDYLRVLCEADVVVSTARHEFFGVAMLEAVHCGCYPLCPKALVYPEIFPAEYLYNTPEQLCKRLQGLCRRPDVARNHVVKVDTSAFSWTALKERFETLLSAESP